MDGRQAYLRPSSAAIWSKCNGYAKLCASLNAEYVEEPDNEIREDGLACHWLAVELWEGRSVSPGALSPNGREVTDEMIGAVAEYHTLLRSWGVPVTLEQLAPVSQSFPGVSDGTPDAWGYSPSTCALDVGDLKYGYRPVEVWRNAQLIVYAWTLVCMLAAKPRSETPQRIRLHICQPRCPHPDGTTRTWELGINELAALAAELAAAAAKCHEPDPLCVVNAGCRNCVAAHGCRTLQAAALDGVEVSYRATPFELNEAQLGYELATLMRAQKHIENRITGLSTQAESLIRKGRRIPGFSMGRAATRWRWRAGAEQHVLNLARLLGVDAVEPTKPKSVAKLRGAFPGLDIQAMYAEKPTGEMKLIAVDPNEALKRFGK